MPFAVPRGKLELTLAAKSMASERRSRIAERLQLSRQNAGFPTPTQAAKRFGWVVSTYLAHERGTSRLGIEQAKKYASAFNVADGWLIAGDDTLKRGKTKHLRLLGYIGNGGLVYPVIDRRSFGGIEEIEVPGGQYDKYAAFKIRGSSNYPAYRDGDVVFALMSAAPPASNVGRDCIVRTRDGRGILTHLLPGSQTDRFYLLCYNERPIVNARILVAWPIEWVRKWRSS